MSTTRAIKQESKLTDYKMLVKARLTSMVVFSAGIGYVLGAGYNFSWVGLAVLCLGGFLITGASNALNQVLEKDYDSIMKRTANRPLATGRMSVSEAVMAAGFMSLIGITLLALFNPLTALIGTVSMIIYAFIYTPVKRVSPIAVLIGAIPGALPPMIGWVAATGNLGIEALALFGIQFLWQFPHFWAIAWVGNEDYTKAGYKLLPSKGGKDKQTALQCLIYTLFMLPMGVSLFWLGVTGWISAVIVTGAGLMFTYYAWKLYKECTDKAALHLMFSSFVYLPVTLIALMMDLM